MGAQIGLLQKTNGLVVFLMVATALLAIAGIFRPHRPSAFSEHGGYGVGHGTESIMFGANGRKGALR
jgi:hypothetical protein